MNCGSYISQNTFSTMKFCTTLIHFSLSTSSSVKSKEEASSTEEDWDADEKEEAVEEKKETKIKSPKVYYNNVFYLSLKSTIMIYSII